jgi:hypothetical protein
MTPRVPARRRSVHGYRVACGVPAEGAGATQASRDAFAFAFPFACGFEFEFASRHPARDVTARNAACTRAACRDSP